jgi:opacity protein-like surface antigen
LKKTFATLALLAIATTASAGVTAFTTYDYDRANEGQGAWKSQHEAHVGAALGTKFGTVDAAVVGRQLVTNKRDDNLGFELGYSNGLKLGAVGLTGRVAYGQINQVDTKIGGFSGNSAYYSLAAEASTPLASTVTGFVGYRFRGDANGDTPLQNRFTVGADVALAKNVALRAGYAFTKQNGVNYNGLTTAVSYKF